jgi:hypothetical protein
MVSVTVSFRYGKRAFLKHARRRRGTQTGVVTFIAGRSRRTQDDQRTDARSDEKIQQGAFRLDINDPIIP